MRRREEIGRLEAELTDKRRRLLARLAELGAPTAAAPGR